MAKPGRPRKERYARLMGSFHRNDKVRRISLEACGLLAKAWSYSADQMTDGRVPVEMLQMWAGKRFAALMKELAGFLTVEDIDAIAHDWADINITADEWERRLEGDRARKWSRKGGEFPGGNGTGNNAEIDGISGRKSDDIPDDFQRGAPTRTKKKKKSSLEEQETTPAADEPPRRLASELEARYPSALIAETRHACALARKNGKMADTVWLTTLERLEAFPVDAVARGCRIFVDKHADGEKDEAYLIGIVRREARGNGRLEPQNLDPDLASAGNQKVLAMFGGGFGNG